MTEPNNTQQKILMPTIFVILLVIAALIAFSWFLTRGLEDDQAVESNISPTRPSEYTETAPTNPNVTGGSDGTGSETERSNDPNIETPSPAGGVDTNNIPAGESSSP